MTCFNYFSSLCHNFVSTFVSAAFKFGRSSVLAVMSLFIAAVPLAAQESLVLENPAAQILLKDQNVNPFSDIDFHDEYMKYPGERIRIAETIGERGAANYAKSQGWECILDGNMKNLRQGFDQVYVEGDKIHIVEAKGGSARVNQGYGHKQGSSEWAVEAARKTLKSHQASEAEHEAAKRVLRAAAEKKIDVTVIQTGHRLGRAVPSVVKSQTPCTDNAASLAVQYLDRFDIPRSAGIPKPVLESLPETAAAAESVSRTSAAAGDVAETIAKNAGKLRWVKGATKVAKGAGIAGVTADAGMRIYESAEVEDLYKKGRISESERNHFHIKNGGSFAGGLAGAYVGAKAGGALGAGVGTFVFPGAGTAVGGFVGGAVGAVGGYIGGEKAAGTVID